MSTRFVLVLLGCLVLLASLLFGLLAYRRMVFAVRSDAMAPTLRAGDLVMAEAWPECGAVTPQPGDMVLYLVNFPGASPGLKTVMRIVARAGDQVELRAGALYVNGRPASRDAPGVGTHTETLANGQSYTVQSTTQGSSLDDFGPAVVPSGAYFVLGDSRDNANDSRIGGPVTGDRICAVTRRLG